MNKQMTKITGTLTLAIAAMVLVGGLQQTFAANWEWTNEQGTQKWDDDNWYNEDTGTYGVPVENDTIDIVNYSSDGDQLIVSESDETLPEFNDIDIGTGSDGRVDVTGNTFRTIHSSNHGTIQLGDGTNTGILNQSGGTVHISRSAFNLTDTGIYNLSGGTWSIANKSLSLNGTANIIGDAGTMTVGADVNMSESGTLSYAISSTGITPVEAGGAANLDGVLELKFMDGVSPRQGSWDVMTFVDGSYTDGLTLSADPALEASYEFVDTNDTAGADTLRVHTVPEPSSLVLLGIAGLLLMKRRRV